MYFTEFYVMTKNLFKNNKKKEQKYNLLWQKVYLWNRILVTLNDDKRKRVTKNEKNVTTSTSLKTYIQWHK